MELSEYSIKEEDIKKSGHSKEYMRNYMKKYLDKKNIDNVCDVCGGKYKTFNKSIHEKTTRHLKGVQNYEKKREDELIEKQKFTQDMYNNLMTEIQLLKQMINK